jgi:putative ABC transport system permease protein
MTFKVMIKNYLIIAIRNLWRQKLYSILNILGLSLALAVSMIIMSHVRSELSYDKHFPKADRIYRIINKTVGPRGKWDWANGSPLMAEQIQVYVPEIEKLTRLRPMEKMIIENRSDTANIIKYEENLGYFADSTVFEIFDINILTGDKKTALRDPGSMVLTQSLAYKIYGDDDPIGKILYFDRFGSPLHVTAVISDFPETSHLKINFFVDWQSFIHVMKIMNLEDIYNSHGWAGVYTYALLKENVRAGDLKSKLMNFRKDFYDITTIPEDNDIGEFALQPITDIHLRSNLEQEMGPNGNITYIIVFIIAAVFILIIAGFNYVNIATSKALRRTREVGLRKIAGARRIQIINQFQSESFLTTILAGALSILIIDLLIPVYNSFAGNNVTVVDLFTPGNIILFMSTVVVLGSLSGIYPSVFVSGYKPVTSIKEEKYTGTRANLLRKILIILQFAISVFMIFSTIEIYRQMKYFNKKNLGFDMSHVINIPLNGRASLMAVNNPQMLKDELMKLPFVLRVSFTSEVIGDRFSVEGWTPDKPPEGFNNPALRFLRVDEDFLPLLNINLAEGRNFYPPSGDNTEFIMNKLAVKALGLTDPIGAKGRSYLGKYGEIVGITDNFHFASLHNLIEPLVMEYNMESSYRNLMIGNMLVRLAPGNSVANIESLRKTIEKIAPGTTFNYSFLDKKFEQLYKNEASFRDMFKAFAIFTIFISCLGLFGLSSYTAESRTKEIGIRKSMGAETGKIAVLISQQFLVFVLIGLLISLPVGYFYIKGWLQNFAYHINILPQEFIYTALIAFVVAIVSVSLQAIRAGRMNPADSLRYE